MILDRAGHAVRPDALEKALESMRGPGWSRGSVSTSGAVGWAWAWTEGAPADEERPTGNGPVVLADARIDDRESFVRHLRADGIDLDADAPAGTAILAAYRAWGPQLTERLLGDFAFVVWDPERSRLVAARDHFGIRSLYYAENGGLVVVSNTLRAIRRMPGMAADHDELALCDFLLFGKPLDLAATPYARIRRVPPAHRLMVEGRETIDVRRYWELPVEEPVRFRRATDYVEAFNERLRAAASDRLGDGRVGVSLSGGLDSSAVLALADGQLRARGGQFDLRAWTVDSPELWPDGHEADLAACVARACSTPHDVVRPEDFPVLFESDALAPAPPEPIYSPQHGVFLRQFRSIAAHASVALTGNGSDPALLPDCGHLGRLLASGQLLRFSTDVAQFVWWRRRLPPTCLRAALTRRALGKTPEPPLFPPGIHPEMARKLGLPERWEAAVAAQTTPSRAAHPYRPRAYSEVTSPHWPFVFWTMGPEVSGVPLTLAHPFFDLRVVTFAMRLPSVPWCVDKWILREAMRGLLPEEVRARLKKTPRTSPNMHLAQRNRGALEAASSLLAGEGMERYVLRDTIEGLVRHLPRLRSHELALVGRPLALAKWMHDEGLG